MTCKAGVLGIFLILLFQPCLLLMMFRISRKTEYFISQPIPEKNIAITEPGPSRKEEPQREPVESGSPLTSGEELAARINSLLSYWEAVANKSGQLLVKEGGEKKEESGLFGDDLKSLALEALSDQPHDLEALGVLAALSYEEGNKSLAREYYDKILQVDPGNRDALEILCRLVSFQGDHQQAVDYCRKLLSGEDSPRIQVLLGENLLAMERFEEALKAVDSALEKDPYYLPALELGGESSAKKLDFGLARRYFSRAVEIREDSHVYSRLGDMCAEEGEVGRALLYWEEACRLIPLNTAKGQSSHLVLLEKMSTLAYSDGSLDLLEEYLNRAEELGISEELNQIRGWVEG